MNSQNLPLAVEFFQQGQDTSPYGGTNWGPSFQIPHPKGDMSHSKHHSRPLLSWLPQLYLQVEMYSYQEDVYAAGFCFSCPYWISGHEGCSLSISRYAHKHSICAYKLVRLVLGTTVSINQLRIHVPSQGSVVLEVEKTESGKE